MNDLERRTLLGAAGLGAIAAMSKAGGGGPLNPPAGPVAGTGRTLDEVYNRIPTPGTPPAGSYDGRTPIAGGTYASTVTISQPGSYVLTGDIVSSATVGLAISAVGATLDLNGFSVRTPSFLNVSYGIQVTSTARNVVVRNGQILGWNIGLDVQSEVVGVLLENLHAASQRVYGFNSNGRAVRCTRCRVTDVGTSPNAPVAIGFGISGEAAVVEDCSVMRLPAVNTQNYGFSVGGAGHAVSRCSVVASQLTNGIGMSLVGTIAYRDNTVVNMTTNYSASQGAGSGGGNV